MFGMIPLANSMMRLKTSQRLHNSCLPESFIQLSEIAILLVQCATSFTQLAIHFANEITSFGKFRQLLLLLRQLTDEKTQADGH